MTNSQPDSEDIGLVSETEYIAYPVDTQQSGGNDELQTDAFLHTKDPEAIAAIELMSKLHKIANPHVKNIRGKDYAIVDMVAVTRYVQGHTDVAVRETKQCLLNQLNDELFSYTTEPDGQFIKDTIFAKLDAIEKERLQTLLANSKDTRATEDENARN